MKMNRRILSLLLVMALAVTLVLPVAAAEKSYVLESKNLAAMDAGAKADYSTEVAGTDNFFTIYYSAKTKIDESSKKWDDGYESAQRLNFGGKMQVGTADDTTKQCIKFTTAGAATVKVWFVQGGEDNRQMGIRADKETVVAQTNLEGMEKNQPYYAEMTLAEAGTYYLGGLENNNNIYKVEVVVSGGPDDSGDMAGVVLALLAVSGLGIAVLKKKEF